MSTRCLLCFILTTSIAAPLRAEDGNLPTPDMLHRFLLKECQKHFDARRKTVAALKTPEDVRKRQVELRKQFLDALGGLSDKRTPLNPQVVGRKEYDGYVLERVIYESRPDHHVTANFYIPEGKGPFPGVLVPCGHSVNGKAAEAYQRLCILMAKNGLAVLCYDPIGQGERVQLLDKMGKPALKSSTGEHTLAGIGAILVGRGTATYRIWDGMRSLDYLAGRPEVDPKRLGCTGNSGGGTLTAYLMALDDRILAAAPSCYITSLERLFATIGPQDAEQNITGQVAFGMEHSDYVTMRAPKPTLILTGTQDYFDIQGAWTSFREAKLLYGKLGHGERVDLFEYDDKHGMSKPRREASMRWMRRWLLNKDDAPTEGDFPIHKDADLQCTRTGQVLEDFKGRSVFDLNAARARDLSAEREKVLADIDPEIFRKKVRRLLAIPDRLPKAKRVGGDERRTILETEPGILVSVVYPSEGNKFTTIHLGTKPQPTHMAVELRGMGRSAVDPKAWDKGDIFGETKEAFLSLHVARPLLGQRVLDLLCLLDHLDHKVHLEADGPAGIVALHAAALDSRIVSVTVSGTVDSWTTVVKSPMLKGQLSNVVPGVLAFYDLPDLMRLIGPRKLKINK